MQRLAMAIVALLVTLSTAVATVPAEPKYIAHTAVKQKAVKHKSIKRKPKPTPKPRYATFIVTAYTANDIGMNGKAVTADGHTATPFYTVAASSRYPFGTVFKTSDGRYLRVEDRGGAITGDKLDLYVGLHDTETAMRFGKRVMRLQIVKIGKER